MKDFAGEAAAHSLGGSHDLSSDSAAQIAASFSGQSDSALNEKSEQLLFESKEIPLSASGKERADHGAFLIFGYMTNHAGEIRSLLLADVRTRRARFAGKLSLDELSESECKEIQRQLDRYRSARPALRIPNQARWVQPVLLARIVHVGWTVDGQLREGYLVSMEQTQKPNPVTAQRTVQP